MIAYVENSARPETWARDTGWCGHCDRRMVHTLVGAAGVWFIRAPNMHYFTVLY